MLNRIKGLGTQVATTAGDAALGITSSIKSGAESIANAATAVTDAINEKAVRASTAQMCSILEIAVEEWKSRQLSQHPVSLTAAVNFGIATLEMQIHLSPSASESAPGSENVPIQPEA